MITVETVTDGGKRTVGGIILKARALPARITAGAEARPLVVMM